LKNLLYQKLLNISGNAISEMLWLQQVDEHSTVNIGN